MYFRHKKYALLMTFIGGVYLTESGAYASNKEFTFNLDAKEFVPNQWKTTLIISPSNKKDGKKLDKEIKKIEIKEEKKTNNIKRIEKNNLLNK